MEQNFALILIFLHILDPGSRGQKDTGSRIRIRNTGSEHEKNRSSSTKKEKQAWDIPKNAS
jgi:hypothetical protein